MGMKVRIIKTSIIYELPESYAMRLIEQRMAEFVSGDIPVTPEPEPEDIDQQQYEIGPDKKLNNFSQLLRALKDDARSKRIDLYEGTYDILEEMGGQEFLDGLTGKEKWYEILPVVPPNTEIVGHGRVEITMKLPETASESALDKLSPVTLMGSAKLKNLTIRCDTGYACVRAEVAGIADFSGAVWEIENCTLEYSKDILVLGDGGVCCVYAMTRSGVELHMRSCVCKAGATDFWGHTLRISNNGLASVLSPRVCIEDCALDGGMYLSCHTPPWVNPFTVVDVKIENSHINGGVYKEAQEETSEGLCVDCYRVTYINTPATSSSYNVANLIPDVVYDNLDKKKSVLYTAQELTDAQKAQARTNISAAASVHTHDASEIDSGTLPVSRGGTGRSTLTSGYYLAGNGTSSVKLKAPADVLSDIGAAASRHTHALTDDAITGVLPASKGGLPAVTAEDNGKFLRVVDGAWTAATVPDAAEVKF